MNMPITMMDDNELDIETQIGNAADAPRNPGPGPGAHPIRVMPFCGKWHAAIQSGQGQDTKGSLIELKPADHFDRQVIEQWVRLQGVTLPVQPASWNIERLEPYDRGDGQGEVHEVIVQSPDGGGITLRRDGKGPLAQRLLAELAFALTEPRNGMPPVESTAELFLELRAESGYTERSHYASVTPQQWGDLVRVLNGARAVAERPDPVTRGWLAALSDARYAAKGNDWLAGKIAEVHCWLASPSEGAALPWDEDRERQAFEDAAYAHYLRVRAERMERGVLSAADTELGPTTRDEAFARHADNGEYVAHVYQHAWGGWKLARGGI